MLGSKTSSEKRWTDIDLIKLESLCVCISVVDKKGKEDSRFAQFRPEALDSIRMEDLVKEYLTSKDNVRRHL